MSILLQFKRASLHRGNCACTKAGKALDMNIAYGLCNLSFLFVIYDGFFWTASVCVCGHLGRGMDLLSYAWASSKDTYKQYSSNITKILLQIPQGCPYTCRLLNDYHASVQTSLAFAHLLDCLTPLVFLFNSFTWGSLTLPNKIPPWMGAPLRLMNLHWMNTPCIGWRLFPRQPGVKIIRMKLVEKKIGTKVDMEDQIGPST